VKHKRRRTKAWGQKTGEGTKKPIENNGWRFWVVLLGSDKGQGLS
jgi:hypothetical protein